MVRITRRPGMWREMDQLQREMNRLFAATERQGFLNAPGFPSINIWANEEGQFISAEMPGFSAEDINIDATADTLTISGNRKMDESGDETRYHRNERGYGEFKRTVQLPFMIDTGSVKANFKNGVLAIHLQRAEADKPRKIAVKSAE